MVWNRIRRYRTIWLLDNCQLAWVDYYNPWKQLGLQVRVKRGVFYSIDRLGLTVWALQSTEKSPQSPKSTNPRTLGCFEHMWIRGKAEIASQFSAGANRGTRCQADRIHVANSFAHVLCRRLPCVSLTGVSVVRYRVTYIRTWTRVQKQDIYERSWLRIECVAMKMSKNIKMEHQGEPYDWHINLEVGPLFMYGFRRWINEWSRRIVSLVSLASM